MPILPEDMPTPPEDYQKQEDDSDNLPEPPDNTPTDLVWIVALILFAMFACYVLASLNPTTNQ